MNNKTFDVAIVGAGIVGCSAAYFLAQRGLRVIVCDRGPISGEQSSRAWGFIRQQGRHIAELPLAADALNIWDEIADKYGAESTGHIKAGVIMPAKTAENEEFLNKSYEIAKEQNLPAELLSPTDLAKKVPEFSKGWRSALYTAGDGHAEPHLSTLTIYKAAKAMGVRFETGQTVVGFLTSNGRISGIRTTAGNYNADTVIVATGIGSRKLLKQLNYNPPIQVVRSSVAQTSVAKPFTDIAMWCPGVAFRPRQDGSFVLGNGYQGAGMDYDITLDSLTNLRYFLPAFKRNMGQLKLTFGEDFMRSILDVFAGDAKYRALREPPVNHKKTLFNLERFKELFPHLETATIAKSWAGRLDITPDLIPIIDRLPNAGNVFTACGFSGHGFALGPSVGKQLSQWITEGKPSIDLKNFKHARFANGDFEFVKAV